MSKKVLVLGFCLLFLLAGSAMAQTFVASWTATGDSGLGTSEGWVGDPSHTTNLGTDTTAQLGSNVTPEYVNRRSALVKFDVAENLPSWVTASDIVSATFQFEILNQSPVYLAYMVHRSVYDWDELTVTTANYGSQEVYMDWNTFDANAATIVDPSVTTYIAWAGETGVVNINATDAVQKWISGAAADFGIWIGSNWAYGDAGRGHKNIAMREHETALAPTLIVEYVPEPATIGLLMIGGLALLRRRNK